MVIASPQTAAAGSGPKASDLDKVLRGHGVKGATLGALVVELPSGRIVYERNAHEPMIPASNMKLAVIAAAIDGLGAGFEFETVLARRGADLVVIGGGDPAFGDPRLSKARGEAIAAPLNRWADKLSAEGVQWIAGRLLFDDFIFEERRVHPDWPRDQYQTWYEAPIGGLNLATNCVSVVAAPTAPGQPAALSFSPGNTALSLVNRTKTAKKQTAVIHRNRGESVVRVTGGVGQRGSLGEVTVHDPGLFFASALRTSMATKGIRIEGPIERMRFRSTDGRLPPDLQILARHRTPLRDVAARAGKQSQGMMAEGLIKMLGVRLR
ncbi:MAG: D-alanyl-D-alanine carboxypeptidase, partial [Phycisphaerae bacterium]